MEGKKVTLAHGAGGEQTSELIDKVFKTINTMQQTALEDTEAEVTFGEYANPSFESQIETVGKAKTQGVMSIESIIEELYGATP